MAKNIKRHRALWRSLGAVHDLSVKSRRRDARIRAKN
jgi:hypothetical protein